MTMKRNIYFILALLFLGVVQVRAQKMVVALNDGSEVLLDEEASSVRKITFSDGKMFFHADNTVKNTFDIKSIQRIYAIRYSSVDALNTRNKIEYLPARQEIIVHTTPGTAITMYRTDGVCVLSKVQTLAAPAINIAHLSAGTYVVGAEGETLKFVKQ